MELRDCAQFGGHEPHEWEYDGETVMCSGVPRRVVRVPRVMLEAGETPALFAEFDKPLCLERDPDDDGGPVRYCKLTLRHDGPHEYETTLAVIAILEGRLLEVLPVAWGRAPVGTVREVLEDGHVRVDLGPGKQDPLVTFLYLLMRDHVPTGVVAKLMRDVGEAHAVTISEFSSPEVKALAERYAEGLRGGG